MSSAVTSWGRMSGTILPGPAPAPPPPPLPPPRAKGHSRLDSGDTRPCPGRPPFYRSLTVATPLLRLLPRPAASGPQGGQREDKATGQRSDAPRRMRGDVMARPGHRPAAGSGRTSQSSRWTRCSRRWSRACGSVRGLSPSDRTNRLSANGPGPDSSRGSAPADRGCRCQDRPALDAGVLVSAHVYLRMTPKAPRLIAHEMERIVEQLDGVDLRAQAGNGVVWKSNDAAFETSRAMEAGHRVAREIANTAGRGEPQVEAAAAGASQGIVQRDARRPCLREPDESVPTAGSSRSSRRHAWSSTIGTTCATCPYSTVKPAGSPSRASGTSDNPPTARAAQWTSAPTGASWCSPRKPAI